MNRTLLALTAFCLISLAPEAPAQTLEPVFDAPVVMLGEHRRIEWVTDLDGDGFPDAVGMYEYASAANENLKVYGWVNDGHGRLIEIWEILLPQIDTSSVKTMKLGDLNGDAREDMVVIGDGKLFALLSRGTLAPTSHLIRDLGGQRASTVGDFDGDGDQDIAVTRVGNSTGLDFFLNLDGSGTQWSLASSRAFEPEYDPTTVLTCDLDGNATDDVVVSNWEGDHRFFPVLSGVSQPLAFGYQGGYSRLAYGDIDGDGDEDFVSFGSSFSGSLIGVIRRTGPTTFVAEKPYVGGPATHLADADGDGDLDGVCCGSGGTQQPGPNVIDSYFEIAINDGGVFAPSFRIRGLGARHIGGVADMDRDGDLDLVAGRVVYFAQGPLTRDPRKPAPPLPPVRESIVDVDDDGDPDLDLGLAGGQRNMGDGTWRGAAASFQEAPEGTSFEGPGFPGDFDGDGDEDLIVGHRDGGGDFIGMRLLRNTGGGHLMDAGPAGAPGVDFNAVQGASRNDSRHALVADADGDGDLDLFVRSALYYVDETFLWHNLGSGFLVAGEFFTDKRIAGVGHFDGDGIPDLVANQDTLEVLWGTAGGGHVQGPELHSTGSLYFERLAVGDVNGDGNDDIVDFAYQGVGSFGVHAFLSDGAGNFTPTLVADTDGEWPHDMQLADVDGDGNLDVLAWPGKSSDTSTLVALYNPVGRTWDVLEEQILGQGAYADLDGDGDVDHVGEAMVENMRFDGPEAGARIQRGAGTPGTGGVVPVLGARGPFRVGNTAETYVRGTRGGAEGVILLSVSATPTPLGALPGGTLIQDFGTLRRVMPFQCDGIVGEAGAGSFTRAYEIQAGVAGTTWRHRCVIFDRDAPDGRAWTNEMVLRYE